MAYTINANARNVWIRDNEDTRDLSIQTDASSIYLDNGRTLEQELGEGSMVSNVATVDSAMSKIIDGTLDGAYESCVFKGKSLVNLGREIDSQYHNIGGEGTQITSDGYFKIPYAGSENSHSVRLKFGLLEPLIKPDTVYSLIVEIAENTTQNARIGFTEHNNLSCVEPVDRNTNIASTVGTHVKLIKRRSEVTARQSDLYFCIWDKTNVDATKHIKFRYMILEGDWTNKELPPFFTGLCDVKMPILRNVGKNLHGGEVITNKALDFNIGELYDAEGYNALNYYTPVSQGSTITISNEYGKLGANTFIFYNSNKEYTGFINVNGVATIPKGVCYVRAYGMSHIMMGSIQIEESSYATTYEDHKTNILRTSEEIVLRSVGDIKDSYNALTGEYVQRIVEYVFNGSESEAWNFAEMKGDNYRFGMNLPTFGNKSADETALICDRLKVGDAAQEPEQEQITTYNHGSYFELRVTLSPSTLASNNVDELRRYLQANPITIQYVLAEPITTIVEPLTIPFAYQNGHVILESGHEGQSLLPMLEYSTVVNKTGQVESVAKTIQTQEKQLTMLEQMLIQNIIGLDYNNTVLALNLEINEVM